MRKDDFIINFLNKNREIKENKIKIIINQKKEIKINKIRKENRIKIKPIIIITIIVGIITQIKELNQLWI